ncbi:MAG: sodium-translocating pyrophosphatase [Candidatus Hydrothermales bacterium]
MEVIIVSGLIGLSAVIYSLLMSRYVLKHSPGNEEMVKISNAIYEGAMAFLKREFKTILWFILFVVILILIGLSYNGISYSLATAISYITGSTLSLLSAYFGMSISTRANARTAEGARKGFSEALKIAFFGGSVMGMTVAGLGVLGITVLFLTFTNVFKDVPENIKFVVSILTGFSMGASSVALFARVGGGIYTKAADVGADLVGKVEAGIPEDDPRNAAVIADNVGDNVGDCAGMGADLYESFVGSILSGMVIAAANADLKGVYFSVFLAALGVASSIISVFTIKTAKENASASLLRATLVSAILFAIFSFLATVTFYGNLRVYWAILSGLLVGVLIGYITEYYTINKRILEEIAEAATKGVATNILAGVSVGMMSVVIPVILISIAIIISYISSGFFGIALAGIGMLSIAGMTVSVDAYGPIADNAGGIAQMSHLGEDIRKITDSLDAAGNTTAAIGKGFAIGSAALTALALFTAYSQTIRSLTGISLNLNILDARVVAGLFIGGIIPFFFSASAIKAVGKTAGLVVEEVRRQFREIQGLMEGKAKPEYARCVDITTQGALKSMIIPSLVAFFTPLVMGIILGPESLGGLLAGSLVTGVPLALFMANSGGAWDNSKKYIEAGNYGGKGSKAHKASVEGDTVGDPFKDTAGPSLNILLKLMAIVSLVFAPLIITLNNKIGVIK